MLVEDMGKGAVQGDTRVEKKLTKRPVHSKLRFGKKGKEKKVLCRKAIKICCATLDPHCGGTAL